MDFALPSDLVELRDRVLAFVRDEVIPLEETIAEGAELSADVLAAVRDKARAAGDPALASRD